MKKITIVREGIKITMPFDFYLEIMFEIASDNARKVMEMQAKANPGAFEALYS